MEENASVGRHPAEKRGGRTVGPISERFFSLSLSPAYPSMPFPLSTFVCLYVSLAKKNRTVPKEDGPKSRSVLHFLSSPVPWCCRRIRTEDIYIHLSADREMQERSHLRQTQEEEEERKSTEQQTFSPGSSLRNASTNIFSPSSS